MTRMETLQIKAPDDRRRDQYPFLGLAQGPDVPWGRFFPDTDRQQEPLPADMFSWFLQEKNFRTDGHRPYYERIKQWRGAILTIFDCNSLHEVRNLCSNHKKRDERRHKIEERLFSAIAQRHRINITDRQGLELDLGVTLKDTRNDALVNMPHNEFLSLVKQGLREADNVISYFDDPDIGIFSGLGSKLRSHVNEVFAWQSPVDHLFSCFDENDPPKKRFESRRHLVIFDSKIEDLLWEKEIIKVREEFNRIVNSNLFVAPGPTRFVHFKTLHDPHNYSVVGVELLKDGDTYKPGPNIQDHTVDLRECKGGIYVQLDESVKPGPSLFLKKMRNNKLDPVVIEDAFRAEASFLNRRDIERFVIAFKRAAKDSGNPIVSFEIEENSLDGTSYKVSHAGSSRKYQVKRIKLRLESHPHVPIELSCYTLEADINKRFRKGVSVPHYLLSRQILFDNRKVDTSVVNYLYPPDIYHINFEDYLSSLFWAAEQGTRVRAYVPSSGQTHRPRYFSPTDIAEAAQKIAEAIQPIQAKRRSLKKHPRIVVALDTNSSDAAGKLAKHFGAEKVFFDDNKGIQSIETKLRIKLEKLKREYPFITEGNILFIKDVGESGQLISSLRKVFPSSIFAVLALKEGSKAVGVINLSGKTVPANEFVVFPTQEREDIHAHRTVFALVGRKRNGVFEVLLQEEEDGDFKLPGGTFISEKDDNSFETLRRELSEELGRRNMLSITRRLVNIFPIDIETPLNPKKPNHPVNTLYLRGYAVNGSTLETDKFKPPKGSGVVRLHWLPIDKAVKIVSKPGSRKLLVAYNEAYQSGRFSL